MRFQRYAEAINRANAAQSLAAVIFNQAASLKKQHYLPLFDNWISAKGRVEKGERAVDINLETPPAIHFPLSELSELVFGKLTLNGRPLAALSELLQAQQTFNHLMVAHENIRKELYGKPNEYAVAIYLSLKTQKGQDSRYQDWCEGSLAVLDDFLFFSEVLAKDLVAHADRMRKRAGWRMRFSLPHVNSAPKLLPEAEHLMPNHDYHRKWLDNHLLTEPKRWLGFLWFKRPGSKIV